MRYEIVHKAWLAVLLGLGLIPMGHAADNLSFKGNLVEEALSLIHI